MKTFALYLLCWISLSIALVRAVKPISVVELATSVSDTDAPKLFCNYTSESCHHGVPVINNCGWWCFCNPNGSYSTPIQCPKNNPNYNVNLYACEDDTKVCAKTPTDPALGGRCLDKGSKTRASNNCRQYYECAYSSPGTWTLQQCLWGQYFNYQSNKCSINWLYFFC